MKSVGMSVRATVIVKKVAMKKIFARVGIPIVQQLRPGQLQLLWSRQRVKKQLSIQIAANFGHLILIRYQTVKSSGGKKSSYVQVTVTPDIILVETCVMAILLASMLATDHCGVVRKTVHVVLIVPLVVNVQIQTQLLVQIPYEMRNV